MNQSLARTLIPILIAAAFAGFIACSTHKSRAPQHPQVGPSSQCSSCHQDWRATLSHTSDFDRRHKFLAAQQQQVCGVCHAQSFCADCHANQEEIKPSDKYKDTPARNMPHRGNYLAQHRIDGRINPASCFPCHGRQNNERCKLCHR